MEIRISRQMQIYLLLSFCVFRGTPLGINNQIIGTPVVKCNNDIVTLDINTKNPFSGNVFVKGKSKDPSCSQEFQKHRTSFASYTMQLGRCGMQRLRSANPRGMNFMITLVVSFHPIFVTMVDRAYHINCFYMEPEEFVSANIEVSMIPTTALSDSMSMPTCEYSVRRNTPDGPRVTFANVGDTVYHVWECKGPDMGIMVKKCYANDGRGQEVAVVDYNGCVLDDILLDELTYDTSLMRAYALSMVFKYADESQLFFTCQIRLCQKTLGLCKGITPPRCNFRNKRNADKRKTGKGWISSVRNDTQKVFDWSTLYPRADTSELPEIDVLSPEVVVMDLDKPLKQPANQESESTQNSASLVQIQGQNPDTAIPGTIYRLLPTAPPGGKESTALCLSPMVVAVVCGAILSLVILSSVVSIYFYKSREAFKFPLYGFGCSSSASISSRDPAPEKNEQQFQAHTAFNDFTLRA